VTTLEAARAGNPNALADLFRDHFPAAVLVARREGANDPEDIAAQVMADIFDLVRAGRGPTKSFRAYVASAVKFETWRQVKADRRCGPLPEWLPQYVSPEPDSDPELIREAFAALPDRWRWVLQLVDIERIKPADIAARTNLSANAVSALAYRARVALRAEYNALVQEDDE
jgi:DNA-directed RNA polymerase specialized sigma24 family protein